MEFWFASHTSTCSRSTNWYRRHTHGGVARAKAEPVSLNGMFKGFIDLTFEHQGVTHVAGLQIQLAGRR